MTAEPIVAIWSRYHDAIFARLCELYWCYGFVPIPHGGAWWPF